MSLRDRLQQSLTIERGVEADPLRSRINPRESIKEYVRQEVAQFKNEIVLELRKMIEEKIGEEGITQIKGERGYTPQRGVDFFTPQEIEEIKKEITPVKGKHYFDGLPGQDGSDGKIPRLPDIKGMIAKQLPRSEIEKLKQEVEKLKLEVRSLPKNVHRGTRFGGGGGMSDPRHESFTTNGTSTQAFTLARPVAANGTAIIVRYQGQVLDLTTHYTVTNGQATATVTFVSFSNDSGNTLSVTYWPA